MNKYEKKMRKREEKHIEKLEKKCWGKIVDGKNSFFFFVFGQFWFRTISCEIFSIYHHQDFQIRDFRSVTFLHRYKMIDSRCILIMKHLLLKQKQHLSVFLKLCVNC